MAKKKPQTTEHIQYHRDGTAWAKGERSTGSLAVIGNGSARTVLRCARGILRMASRSASGTTYDKNEVYKVTKLKAKQK